MTSQPNEQQFLLQAGHGMSYLLQRATSDDGGWPTEASRSELLVYARPLV